MNTKEKLHQLHLNEWAARFSEQKASGLTVRQWCDQNNFSIHTYNYWKHLLKEELASQVLPDIVPLSIPEPVIIPDSAVPFAPAPPENSSLTNCAIRTIRATATLTIADVAIEVTPGISEEFLRTLIKAVRHA